MKKSAFYSKTAAINLLGLMIPALLFLSGRLSAQCNPDVTPPVCTPPPDMTITLAVWDSLDIDIMNMPDELPKVYAAFGIATHIDNCDGANSDLQESFYLFGPMSDPLKLQRRFFATDAAGNTGEAVQYIWIFNGNCAQDNIPPVCTAPPDMTISSAMWDSLDIDILNMPADQPKIYAAFGIATYTDNCDSSNVTLQESYYLFANPDGSPKKLQRRFFATDGSGNTGEAIQFITIVATYVIHVPAWHYLGQPSIDSMTLAGGFAQVLYDPEDAVFAAPCAGGYSKIERDWYFIDWLYTPPGGNAPGATLPALDLDNDGIVGDAYDIIALGDTIWLYQNNVPTQALMPRDMALTYRQNLYNSYVLRGTVHLDTLQNCALDTGEPGLADFKVKAIGQTTNNVYTAFTDDQGVYELLVCAEDSLAEVGLDLPYNYGGNCPSTYMITPGAIPVTLQNIAVPLNSSCALLTVDIATWRLRPCMSGSYWVNYCNYSDQTIADTYVDVALDTFILYTSATIPGTLQSGNTWRFETGDLTPGNCGQFRIDFTLDCDVPAGMTHCTEAHIFPTDDCPPPAPWSGADLRASGYCDGDSIRFQIRNVGGGAMANQLDFVVTEDLIMAKTSSYQLDAGGTLSLAEPSNGSTWRLETPQEPGHPWGGVVAAVVEGCAGLNMPGLVNIFPINDPDPFSSVDCTENTSSYDPNDKQAFPTGYADEHFIRQNTDLEYLIRFQNTGTDTAFNVVLLDTLSQYLDVQKVRPGASSHSYDFDVVDGNVLRFRFDNILLPDSNVNEAASHGFVKFRVAQQPDNPLGTVINNQTAIYFDFNDPVITNTTWHTVGDNFILVSTDNPGIAAGRLLVYPNPAAQSVFFELPEAGENSRFMLVDGLGKTVSLKHFTGKTCRFDRGALSSGIYYYRISDDRGMLYSGRIVIE